MKTIIELSHNGDPYGKGFWGSQSDDGGKSWVFRGDVGAMPRQWWRWYARKNNFTLREVR
jgi:hypothetical protein